MMLNSNTKKAQGFIRSYLYACAKYPQPETLYHVYTKPSKEKLISFDIIKSEMKSKNGYGLLITGAGTYIYSCAYKYENNGNVYLVYHTAYNRYTIPLS